MIKVMVRGFFSILLICSYVEAGIPNAPKEENISFFDSKKRTDPYHYFLNEQDPRVLRYLEEENSFAEDYLSSFNELRWKIFHELNEDSYESNFSPYLRYGYLYYTKELDGARWICRKKKDINSTEENIFNIENLAAHYGKGFSFVSFIPSPNGKYIALISDRDPSEQHNLCIYDLERKKLDTECGINNIEEEVLWCLNSDDFIYVQKNQIDRAFQACSYHIPSRQKKILLEESDSRFIIQLKLSSDGNVIFFHAKTPSTSEISYMCAENGEEEIKLYLSRKEGIRYQIDVADSDHFFILANIESLNYRLFLAPKQDPAMSWKEVIPHNPAIIFCDMIIFQNYIVLVERREGLPALEIIDRKKGFRNLIHFSEPVFAFELQDNYEYNSNTLRFSYWSPKNPPTLFDYHMNRKELIPLHQELKNFDSHQYITERIFAKAQDGTMIPISILRKKEIHFQEPLPMVLWGYGAYGDPEEVVFSKNFLTLVDRGVVVALAHVRGGGEYGRIWYEQGRLLNKKTTFTDFIDCALYLIEKRYTASDRLAIWGRSAGGMLIGAVLNMRPDLFKAAIADVPFVDVLTVMLDSNRPWTTQEYEEWGNAHLPEYYEYINSYSPYENIKKQEYPALFITGGIFDRLVSFKEPLKLAAKLRDMKTDQNPLLVKIGLDQGHHRSVDQQQDLWLTAGKLTFILTQIQQEFGQSPKFK